MSVKILFFFSPDFVFSKRDNQLILTSLIPTDQKIYTFEGISAELIQHLIEIRFCEDDYSKFAKMYNNSFTIDEWKKLLHFCLEEKIFLQA